MISLQYFGLFIELNLFNQSTPASYNFILAQNSYPVDIYLTPQTELYMLRFIILLINKSCALYLKKV